MEEIGTCTVAYADNVETLSFDWGDVKILSCPAWAGGPSMTFGSVVLQPGKGHERHNHPEADEILYILSGEGEQMLDDREPVTVRPGAMIHIPRGIYHSTMNTGSEPLRFVVVYAPAGDGDGQLVEQPDVEVRAGTAAPEAAGDAAQQVGAGALSEALHRNQRDVDVAQWRRGRAGTRAVQIRRGDPGLVRQQPADPCCPILDRLICRAVTHGKAKSSGSGIRNPARASSPSRTSLPARMRISERDRYRVTVRPDGSTTQIEPAPASR